MKGQIRRIPSLLATILLMLGLMAGCSGGGEAEAPASEPTSASATAPTEAAPVAETPPAEAEASTDDAASIPVDGVGMAVEEIPAINSYRLNITVDSETARGKDLVQIVGEYVKEPRAEHILFNFVQGEDAQEMEISLVDGASYIRTGETWIQSPESVMSNVAEMTLITPQNIAGILDQMELVGTETVNGYTAQHYRGGKEIIPVVGTGSDTLDVSGVEAAQLDLWVEMDYQAIVRLTMEASNTEPAVQVLITFDYTDLNAEIEIGVPDAIAALPATDAPPAGDFVPNNELGELLGFNLMFPTGSTVETVVGANLYVIVGPYTLDESPNFIETTMQANGYTQVSKSSGPNDEVIYLFQKEQKSVSITLTDAGNGRTRFQFATGP